MRRLIVYGFAVLAILNILYGIVDDLLTGSTIYYDFLYNFFYLLLNILYRIKISFTCIKE